MKRKFTFLIAAAVMLLTMVATTGRMWGQTTYALTIQTSDFNTTSYAANNGNHTKDAVDVNNANNTMSVTWVSNQVMQSSSVMQWQKNNGYIYNTTDLGTINSVTVNSTAGTFTTYYGTEAHPTSGTTVGNGFFTTQVGNATGKTTSIVINFTVGGGSAPYITASNVNLTYDATESSIAYTVDNPVEGGTMSSMPTTGGDWLTVSGPNNGIVPLSCSANPSALERTAIVRLTYTYEAKETVTKDVTVTQAGNPNVFDNISDITEVGTAYRVKGTVVAINSKGFIMGDGTGYVYTYLNDTPSVEVGDMIKVSGTTGSYGHIIQFTSSATIEEATESNYDGTPDVTEITEVPDYSEGYHLATYLQFEGELTTSNNNYFVAVGEGQIRITYPTNDQTTELNPLLNKTVRVHGFFSGISGSGNNAVFTTTMESVEEVTNPIISIDPETANQFTYVFGAGPSAEQVFEVTGSNLTSDDIVATITTGAEYFEITDDAVYSNTVTVNSGDVISIRMKAGLAKGNYNGVLTLTNEGAENVVVNLTGTVTGATYTIESIASNGNITFAPASPVEDGTEVTMTAVPNAGYEFVAESWVFYNAQTLDIVVVPVTDGNKITMPACNLAVDATFNAKPTYAITKVVTPENSGTVETDDEAWEGKEVTVLVEAANGYTFSSIIISKTGEPATTISTTGSAASGFTFTMPAYAVTATATFTETYTEGTFAKYTAEITEGYYVITYDENALKNVINSNRFANGEFSETDNIITNPDPSIVWYISPNGDYWTIYNDAIGKYAAGTNTKNQGALIENVTDLAKWTVTVSNGVFQFENLGRSNAASDSGNKWLRNNGNSGWACYANATGGALTLYKMTTLTERTITFNGNGGTYNEATTYTQVVYDGVSTALTANQFTKANAEFAGWALTADGDVVYADQAEVTINDDLGLYAKWSTLYTLTVDNNIDGGSVSIVGSITSAVEGTEITLSYSPSIGHALSAWNVYKTGDPETTVTVTDNKFNMPAYNVTVSATFVEAITYSLITDASQIVSGKHYIIANGTDGSVKVMAGQNTNNRTSVVATATNNVIPETEGIYEFVINGPTVIDEVSYYTIYDTNEASTGYLYAAGAGGSSNNYLKTQQTNNNKGLWTISISNDNKATIKANETGRNWMRNNGTIFACYASGQSDIYLFVKNNDNNYEYYGSEITYSGTSIPSGETLTVGTGSVMTISNNSFTNGDPANLVIEDGGQLVFNNDNVQATMKKSTAHAGAKAVGDWYTIASPLAANVATDGVTHLTTGISGYDLYRYDEESSMWENIKAHGDFTQLEVGRGYLYWNADGVDIEFAGKLRNDDVTYNLTADGTGTYKGMNLIGNPFSQDITVSNITGATLTGGYVLSKAGAWSAEITEFKPCQGFLVQVNAAKNITISKSAAKSRANRNYIAFTVANSQYEDVTYAMFEEGLGLNKINHRNANIPMLYIAQNDENYAIATMSDETQSFNLNFKAMTTGQYTLSYKAEGKYDYLHVIDRLTGEDIDMLLDGEYSFIASPSDNDARFIVKLGYNTNNSAGNDIFAYQNGSDIIVNGEGELQVFDVTGRMVATQHVNGVQTVNVPSQGVFIFKLNEKTQKIVVR